MVALVEVAVGVAMGGEVGVLFGGAVGGAAIDAAGVIV